MKGETVKLDFGDKSIELPVVIGTENELAIDINISPPSKLDVNNRKSNSRR